MSKSSLFATGNKKDAGGAGGGTASSSSSASGTASNKPVSKTAGINFGVFTGISSVSDAVKTKNAEDAKKSVAIAEENLKTSLFQWKPDYISAAPHFERASGFYKTAGMMALAKEYLLKSADCHDQSGSYSGAAVAYMKAALMADEESLFSESKATYIMAAERWGLAGDLPKYAECFWKAGKEASKGGASSPTEATELFTRALKTAYPTSMQTTEELKSLHPQLSEIIRSVFSYYLAEEMYVDALALSRRMLLLFAAQGLDASANKARACIVILCLQTGDVVAADQAFVEHLNDSKYLKSIDCRITEEYLMAFKFTDHSKLEAAQKHADNYVFEREMQLVCKGLSLGRTKKKIAAAAAGAAASATAMAPEPEPEPELVPVSKPSLSPAPPATAAAAAGVASVFKTEDPWDANCDSDMEELAADLGLARVSSDSKKDKIPEAEPEAAAEAEAAAAVKTPEKETEDEIVRGEVEEKEEEEDEVDLC